MEWAVVPGQCRDHRTVGPGDREKKSQPSGTVSERSRMVVLRDNLDRDKKSGTVSSRPLAIPEVNCYIALLNENLNKVRRSYFF